MDLAWYLAVNCDRLPETKEDAIGAYRAALESAGIETGSWWDEQLAAALAGAFLQLGWSKTGDAGRIRMVERSPRRMASVISPPSNAYEGVSSAWARGPAVMYDTLASVAIAGVASELHGEAVLDVGAGTGALCRALRGAGAFPFAVDTSVDMLGQVGDAAVLAIAGDMCALPFADCCFDAAVSGFAISHIDAPERALVEMRRVVRRARTGDGVGVRRSRRSCLERRCRRGGATVRISAARLVRPVEDAHGAQVEHARVAAWLRRSSGTRGHRHRRPHGRTRGSRRRRRSSRIALDWRTSPRSSIPSQLRAARRSSSSPWPQSANGVKPCGRGSSCSRSRVPA